MRKKVSIAMSLILIVSLFLGCSKQTVAQKDQQNYDGRTFYEIFVRSFNDSNGDGIGDLNGVTEKLDYLKDLGVNGIWLMPINDSPSYHGYDVTDYYKINPQYGTMEDLKKLLQEAHKRDIKVSMDMVINHTSTENKWFKEARADKNSKYRDYYIWSSDSSVEDVISKMNTKTWTKNDVLNDYYYSIFSESMPDLNYDNKEVRQEVKNIAKYYIDMGLDGFRLDAAKWIYEDDSKNIQWWQEYSSYCKSLNKNFILTGEVWDNLYAIAPYQEALDSTFNFPLADSINKGLSSQSIEDLPSEIKDNYSILKEKNKNFVPAPFLSNHDQNRVMSNLGDIEKAKMAAAIYLTLPGTPYIYYGEETGMTGAKPDEHIREPFIWDNKDTSKNTKWMESTNDIDKIALNVQKEDKNSIYNFYKKLLQLRNNYKALRLGEVDKIETNDSGVLNMKRTYDKDSIYVIVNSTSADCKIPLEKGKYEVLLDNKENKKVKSNGTLEVKAGEILIIKK
ncbi:alpha-amylase family glycosyl hydrolase [Clostridium manihotivorum]|uniref:Alpha-amylase n=1 Tax=Clostridium manihotivorum TaxID=2320868 RepID=A0A3R5X463_9CLOT|nr:alpha-amylase family glycosyl hydrolase [Clostridium manihotivorum]QAA34135.1 alpha-amylase [Clostridium manihotivorum]